MELQSKLIKGNLSRVLLTILSLAILFSLAFAFRNSLKKFFGLATVYYSTAGQMAHDNNWTVSSTTTERYAWSESSGWIDFSPTNGQIYVADDGLWGYAYGEQIGWISLNCHNDEDTCSYPYGVSNDGTGVLSGFAWSENAGWIDFGTSTSPSTRPYGVTIDSNGDFQGYAYAENLGWISFNSSNDSGSQIDYKISTNWVPVSRRGVASGLVAYYPLNSDTRDYSENHINGSDSGATRVISGKVDGAYDFGGGAYISTVATTTFTFPKISSFAWVKTTDSIDLLGLFGNHHNGGDGNVAWIVFLNNGKPTIQLDADNNSHNADSSIGIADGSWHYVGFTYDGTSLSLYVDNNAPITTNYSISSYSQANNPLYIGAVNDPSGVQQGFIGQIDEVAIWNRALSPSEISYLYNEGNGQAVLDTSNITSELGVSFVTPPTPQDSDTVTSRNIPVELSYSSSTAPLYSFVNLDNSLVGWWRGEDNAKDSSGNHSDGNWGGTPAYDTGEFGRAFSFDGSSQYVSVPGDAGLNIHSNITMSSWAYFNGEGTNNSVVLAKSYAANNQAQYAIIRYSGSRTDVPAHDFDVSFNINGTWTDFDSGYLLADYTWYHLSATYDGRTVREYVNGTLVHSVVSPGTITGDTSHMLIGADDWGGSPVEYMNGMVDDTMIFSRVLSASEISSLYNSQSSQFNYSLPASTGSHTIKGIAVDAYGVASTSVRTVGVVPTAISTSFISPTPADNTAIDTHYIPAKLSYSSPSAPLYSFVNLDNSLVGWWRGEDNVKDSTGSHDGIWHGTESYDAGQFGDAINFQGSGDYVSTSGNIGITGKADRTVSTWIYKNNNNRFVAVEWGTNSPGGLNDLLVTGTGDGFINKLGFHMAYGGYYGSINIPINQWVHIAETVKNGNPKLYVNGVLDTGATPDSGYGININTVDGPVSLGTEAFWGPEYAQGKIDETMIFNRALSDSEISSLYDSQATQFNTRLLASVGSHTIKGVAVDANGVASTSQRTISINSSNLDTSFISPTPTDNATINTPYIPTKLSYSSSTAPLYSFVNLDNSLLGWWRGEDNVIDSAGGHNGSWSGAESYTTGKFGEAMDFIGNGDYVSIPNNSSLKPTSAVTVSAWVKPSSGASGAIFESRANSSTAAGYTMFINGISSNKIGWLVHTTGASGGQWNVQLNAQSNFVPNTWYHVVGVYAPGDARFYINNVLQSSTNSVTGNIVYDSAPTTIGATNGGDNSLNASVDDVIVFNRVLSSSEISSLYDSRANQFNVNLPETVAGSYTIKGIAVDANGVASTSERTVNVDPTSLGTSFISPTPTDNSTIYTPYIPAKLSYSSSTAPLYSFVNLDNSLLGWWRGEGTSRDSSDNHNDGTWNGTPTYVTGNFGRAMSFNGGNSVSLPISNNLSIRTLSLWVKYDSSAQQGHAGLFTNNITGLRASFNGANLTHPNLVCKESGSNNIDHIADQYSVPTNQWFLMTVSVTGSHILWYKNGQLVQDMPSTIGSMNAVNCSAGISGRPPEIWRIGYNTANGTRFNGQVDDTMIFSRVLSASEISFLYDSQASQFNYNLPVANGSHTIKGVAVDATGAASTLERTVNIDSSNLSTSFISPTPSNNSIIYTPYIPTKLSYSGSTAPLYSFVNLDNSLVGWWRGEGTTTDSSGNHNDGSWYGMQAYDIGKFGWAMNFDGASYVDAGNIPALSNPSFLTVSTWVKLNSWNADNQYKDTGIIGTRRPDSVAGGWQVLGDAHNGQHFSIGGDSGCTTVSNYNTGQWYNLVAKFSSATTTLFVDGVQACTGSVSSIAKNSGTKHLWIGNYYDTNSRFLNGQIDDTMIFTRDLSSSEISSLYDSQATQFDNNYSLPNGSHTIKGGAADAYGAGQTDLRSIAIAPLLPPSNFSGSTAPTCNSGVNLSWDTVAGATSYQIFRNSSLVATTTSISYNDIPAASSTNIYLVRAVSGVIISDWSSSLSVTAATDVCSTGTVSTGGRKRNVSGGNGNGGTTESPSQNPSTIGVVVPPANQGPAVVPLAPVVIPTPVPTPVPETPSIIPEIVIPSIPQIITPESPSVVRTAPVITNIPNNPQIGGRRNITESQINSNAGVASNTVQSTSSNFVTGIVGQISDVTSQVVSGVADVVVQSYQASAVVVRATVEKTKEIVNSPTGSIVTKTVATAGVVAGAATTISAIAFANPISFSEVWLLPTRLLGLLVGALGVKRKSRPWGTVYDSVTKMPLDPVYVSIVDAVTGKEVSSAITDLDGRYGFMVPPGRYRIIVKKTNYSFPSVKMNSLSFDEVYKELYYGEEIFIHNSEEIITKDIPMDSQSFDWNEFAKKRAGLNSFVKVKDIIFAKFSKELFWVGLIIASVALIFAPAPYNYAIFIMYAILYILKAFGFGVKKAGILREKASGLPLSFAIVRIFRGGSEVEFTKKIADEQGEYYCLVPKGDYYIKIDKKNDDGSYASVYTSAVESVTNGIINSSIQV